MTVCHDEYVALSIFRIIQTGLLVLGSDFRNQGVQTSDYVLGRSIKLLALHR